MKFSEGTWKAVTDTTPNRTISIVAQRPNPDYPAKSSCALLSRHIASISPHGPRKENESNARLLAAAPELFEACKSVDTILNCVSEKSKEAPNGICDCYCCEVARLIKAAITLATGGVK